MSKATNRKDDVMLRADIDELQVGDWSFRNVVVEEGLEVVDAYIALRLHDGDSGLAILPIVNSTYGEAVVKQANANHACWTWNGNRDAPTLTPSILHWGEGKNNPATWHGYLTDGKLVAE